MQIDIEKKETKTDRLLMIIASTYLLICSLVGVMYFVTGLIQNDLSVLLNWVPIFLCAALITVGIFVNAKILFNPKVKKEWITGDLFLCIIQSVHVFLNGFQLKYNLGFEVVGYLNVENPNKNVIWGIFYNSMNLNLNIKFLDLNNFFVGINFIALALSVFYWFEYKKISYDVKKLND